jgi:carboxypeptidase Q
MSMQVSKSMVKLLGVGLSALCMHVGSAAFAQQAPAENIDLGVLHDIKDQAFQKSQVMDTLFYISDVYGPRLTNSPNHHAAAEWIMKRLESYGLKNVHLEPWGPFGDSWQFKKFYGALVAPNYFPLIGFPLAWTSGTDGPVTGEVVLAPINSEEDFDKYRGKLRGKIVLLSTPRPVPLPDEVESRRFTSAEIEALTHVPDPSQMPAGFGGCQANPPATNISEPYNGPSLTELIAESEHRRDAVNRFLRDEGALVVVRNSMNESGGGAVYAMAGGSYNPESPVPVPMVAIENEHYNRLARLIEHGITPKVTFDIQVDSSKDSPMGFNVIGEIPGTTKKDEVVMIGGHLDSWHGGTGANDDGIGSSVAIEAVRILSQLHRPLARTVRIGLWGGEEEGLLGSNFYVQHHFAARDTMKQTPEYPKLDAYFNQDYGGGRYRAIWAGGNDLTAAIFKQWAAPIRDLEFEAVAGATGQPSHGLGGTDASSFSSLGLNGFTFLQDPLECAYRSSHTNMDLYDRVPPGDAMQSSAIAAWFVYNTANRSAMLPRRETPKAQELEH